MLPRKRTSGGSPGSGKKPKLGMIKGVTVGMNDLNLVFATDPLLDGASSVEQTIEVLMKNYPVLPDKFPPVVWKHQLYAFPGLGSRTDVDQGVISLLNSSKIRCMRIGSIVTSNSNAIVFLDAYERYVRQRNPGKLTDKFLKMVRSVSHYFYTSDDMSDLSESDIKLLIQQGVLANDREVGRWLLSIPGAGMFIRIHELGKKVLIRTIRSTKFKEIHSSELQQRKLPSEANFSFRYYLADLIGSGEIEQISTPAGLLLRLP